MNNEDQQRKWDIRKKKTVLLKIDEDLFFLICVWVF